MTKESDVSNEDIALDNDNDTKVTLHDLLLKAIHTCHDGISNQISINIKYINNQLLLILILMVIYFVMSSYVHQEHSETLQSKINDLQEKINIIQKEQVVNQTLLKKIIDSSK